MQISEPLVTTDLTASYGTAPILTGVSTTVHAGEVVAVIGANGSGKSTFMKACLGLVPKVTGSVQMFGHDTKREPKAAFTHVGYVPQRSPIAPATPVNALEMVTSGLVGAGSWHPKRGGKKRALAALETVGMADRAGDPIQYFSGGQLQRTMIARALVREPDLYLLDEPLAGVDQKSAQVVVDTLSVAHAKGATIVVVLHELGPFEPLITRALQASGGTLKAVEA